VIETNLLGDQRLSYPIFGIVELQLYPLIAFYILFNNICNKYLRINTYKTSVIVSKQVIPIKNKQSSSFYQNEKNTINNFNSQTSKKGK